MSRTDHWITYENNPDYDLKLRAVFVREAPIRDGIDADVEYADLFFWFASWTGLEVDQWFAFAISDDDDPEGILDNSDEDELTRLSAFLGMKWEHLEKRCPHCVANRQRRIWIEMDDEMREDLLAGMPEDALKIRKEGEFGAWQEIIENQTGIQISQN